MLVEIQEPLASLVKKRCRKLHQRELEFVRRAVADALCADPDELARPWSTDREDVLRGRAEFAAGKTVEWRKARSRLLGRKG